MARRYTIKIVLFAVIVSALLELAFLANKFPRYRSAYRSAPVELAHVGLLRVGAVRGQHGTSFVRLSPMQSTVQRWDEPDALEVERETREQLRLVPVKAIGEFLAYALLLLAVLLSMSAAWRRFSAPWSRAAVAAVVAGGAVLYLNASIPLRYGTSMYSTWAGPGAYSFSWPPQRITLVPGETIAHRTVLETLHLIPAIAIERIGRPLRFIDIWIKPPTSFSAMLWRSVGFWALIAFVPCLGVASLRHRMRRKKEGTA